MIGASVLAFGLMRNRLHSPVSVPLPADLHILEPALVELIEECDRAIHARPDDPKAHGRLGAVYEVHGYPDLALRCYAAAVAMDPSDLRWRYFAGVILQERGRLAKAEKAFREVIEKEPDYAPAHQRLGTILFENKRYDQAAEAFTQAVRRSAQQPTGYVGLARVRLETGFYDEAVGLLTSAIATRPSDCEAHHLLGRAYQKLGRLEEAREAFERCTNRMERMVYDPWRDALRLQAATRSGRRERAKKLLSKGQATAALAILEALIAEDAADAPALNMLGISYLLLRRPDDAKEALLRALPLDEHNPTTHVNLSAVLLVVGDHSSALEHATQATRLAPGGAQGFVNQARALLRLRRFDEAAAAFGRAGEVDGRMIDAHRGHCLTLLRLKRFDEAVEACQVAVKLAPASWRDRYNLGTLYGKLGLYQKAVETLSIADKLDPGNSRIAKLLTRYRHGVENR